MTASWGIVQRSIRTAAKLLLSATIEHFLTRSRLKPIRENQLDKAGNPAGIIPFIADFVLSVLLPGMLAPARLAGDLQFRCLKAWGFRHYSRLLALPSFIQNIPFPAPHPHSLPVSTIAWPLRDKLSRKRVVA